MTQKEKDSMTADELMGEFGIKNKATWITWCKIVNADSKADSYSSEEINRFNQLKLLLKNEDKFNERQPPVKLYVAAGVAGAIVGWFIGCFLTGWVFTNVINSLSCTKKEASQPSLQSPSVSQKPSKKL